MWLRRRKERYFWRALFDALKSWCQTCNKEPRRPEQVGDRILMFDMVQPSWCIARKATLYPGPMVLRHSGQIEDIKLGALEGKKSEDNAKQSNEQRVELLLHGEQCKRPFSINTTTILVFLDRIVMAYIKKEAWLHRDTMPDRLEYPHAR